MQAKDDGAKRGDALEEEAARALTFVCLDHGRFPLPSQWKSTQDGIEESASKRCEGG